MNRIKLTVNEWNYRIVGRKEVISYDGCKTRKEAEEFVKDWNSRHPDCLVELVRLVNNKWKVVNDYE